MVITSLRGSGWAPGVRALLVIPIALCTAAAWSALVEWRRGRAMGPPGLAALGCAWLLVAEVLVLWLTG